MVRCGTHFQPLAMHLDRVFTRQLQAGTAHAARLPGAAGRARSLSPTLACPMLSQQSGGTFRFAQGSL